MKHVPQKVLTAILASSLALQACGQQTRDRPQSVETVQEYSSDEIFDGILFKYGRVALAIPELRDSYSFDETFKTLEQKKTATEVIDYIKAKLVAKNPNYLSEFKAVMESGDHVAISNAIETVGNEISTILETNRTELEKSGKGMCAAVVAALVSAVVAQTAVAVNSVAAVSIAVYKYLALWGGGGCANATPLPKVPDACLLADDLKYEQTVDSIAKALSKSST